MKCWGSSLRSEVTEAPFFPLAAALLLLTSSCVQTMLPPPINQNNPCSKKISSFPSLCESFLAVGLYCYPTDSSTGSTLRANSSACLGTGIQRNCPGCFAAMPVYHEMVFWWYDSPVTVSAVAAVQGVLSSFHFLAFSPCCACQCKNRLVPAQLSVWPQSKQVY